MQALVPVQDAAESQCYDLRSIARHDKDIGIKLARMTSNARNRRVIASAGFGAFQRLIQVACTVLVMPILLRVLGPARFGIWGAASSLAWVIGLLDIGIGSALVTLVARSLAQAKFEEASSFLKSALMIGACLSLLALLVAGIVLVIFPIQGVSAVYLIAIVGLGINIPLNSAGNVWMGMQKGYVSGFWELIQTLLTTVGIVAGVEFTTSVIFYVAVVYGSLILSNLGSLVHLFVTHPELRPRTLSPQRALMREVGLNGVMFFGLEIAAGLSFMLDNVLALQLLGPENSAKMAISLRICMAAVGLVIVLSQPLWPAFTEAAHSKERKWILASLYRGILILGGAASASLVILVSYGGPLLRIWLRSNLVFDRVLLFAIGTWILAQAIARIPTLLLFGLSQTRFQIVLFASATSIAWMLKLLMAPKFGVSGILLATATTVLLIVFPASMIKIYRKFRGSGALENRIPVD